MGRVDQGLGQVFPAGPALGKAVTFHRRGGSGVHGNLFNRRQFFWAVAGEPIDGHDARKSESLHYSHVVDQVFSSGYHGIRVGVAKVAATNSAMPFQGAGGGH